jgi:hypothetical protein
MERRRGERQRTAVECLCDSPEAKLTATPDEQERSLAEISTCGRQRRFVRDSRPTRSANVDSDFAQNVARQRTTACVGAADSSGNNETKLMPDLAVLPDARVERLRRAYIHIPIPVSAVPVLAATIP